MTFDVGDGVEGKGAIDHGNGSVARTQKRTKQQRAENHSAIERSAGALVGDYGGGVEQDSAIEAPGGHAAITPTRGKKKRAERGTAIETQGGAPTGDAGVDCSSATEMTAGPSTSRSKRKTARVDSRVAIESPRGARVGDGGAEGRRASDPEAGSTITIYYADASTLLLHKLADSYTAYQKLRKAETERGTLPQFLEKIQELEDKAAAKLAAALRRHPLWPWLAQFPGLGGVHVASFMGRMRDPRRFPSVRALWRYAGLHVVNGRLPRHAKGVQSNWNPKLRVAVLQPGGIAEQIVRLGVELSDTTKKGKPRTPRPAMLYRTIYDAAKVRIAMERGVIEGEPAEAAHAVERRHGGLTDRDGRGVESRDAIETHSGAPSLTEPGNVRDAAEYVDAIGCTRGGVVGEGVESPRVSECGAGPLPPLRPFQIEQRARIIAAKAFVADLWRAWRDLVADSTLPPAELRLRRRVTPERD